MLGRVPLMGLAAGGRDGVDTALGLIASEIATTAALMGLEDLNNLGPESIERVESIPGGGC